MPDLDPIEPFLRNEEPPDDTIVVVRAGPIAAAKIVEHAVREAREHSYKGQPMHSVSVSLTVGEWSIDELLAGPLASRSTYAQSTVLRVRQAGLTLLPTYASPHYDIVLESARYDDAERLLSLFSEPKTNPHKRRR